MMEAPRRTPHWGTLQSQERRANSVEFASYFGWFRARREGLISALPAAATWRRARTEKAPRTTRAFRVVRSADRGALRVLARGARARRGDPRWNEGREPA